jgi:hypothetical protein
MDNNSLPERMRRHIETCLKCKPNKACEELLALHAQFLKEELKLLSTAVEPDTFYYVFNPDCKHDRCSFDIMNCDACIAYSNQLHKNRLEALKAEDAEQG